MSTGTCRACGAIIRPTMRFCEQCGVSLSAVLASTNAPLIAANRHVSIPAGTVLPTGTELDNGRYRVVQVLNTGSFGAVYAAENLRLGKQLCAIKELRNDLNRTPQEQIESEAWFAREANLLMALRHEMIPRIWDKFTEDGRHYLVMDFVPGRNLDQEMAVRAGPLPETEVLAWGIALCSVLEYLHGHQPAIIFRDIKPANIMLTPDGALYLIDFGIARGLNAVNTGGIPRPGTMIGTPGYSPLEQYHGQAEPRSDIYALGATLHRLLTGYDPERGQPLTFPPARSLRSDLHPETENLLARATALQSADRFPDVAALKQALVTVEYLRSNTGQSLIMAASGPVARQSGPGSGQSITPVATSHNALSSGASLPDRHGYYPGAIRNKLSIAGATVIVLAIVFGLFVVVGQMSSLATGHSTARAVRHIVAGSRRTSHTSPTLSKTVPPPRGLAQALQPFVGGWAVHTGGLSISPNTGAVTIAKDVGFCGPDVSQPCDTWKGNNIIPGLQIAGRIYRVKGNTAWATVTSSTDLHNDPIGATIELTLSPHGHLEVRPPGLLPGGFCNVAYFDKHPSEYSVWWTCGA